jgi:CheY-like chemotaxis protein
VLEAETSKAALSMIASDQRVDVLFTDTRLPGNLNGWQLAETARKTNAELSVIYVSGCAVEWGAAVPGSVLLKKPYRLSVLVQAIRMLIADDEALNPLSYVCFSEDLVSFPAKSGSR